MYGIYDDDIGRTAAHVSTRPVDFALCKGESARLHFLELTAIWQSPPRLWRDLLQKTADKVAVGEVADDLRAVRSPALFLPESKPILVKESSCATILLARNGGMRVTSQS